MSTVKKVRIKIPTYKTGAPEPLPVYFEKRPYQGASGNVYPIPYTSEITDEKQDQEYEAVVLENEYIQVTCLPELGGRIHAILDKTNGYDAVYRNKVIKPAMIGLAGPWISGGIEFNYPQHHRPTTYIPAEYRLLPEENAVCMGEFDYFDDLKGMMKLSLSGSCVRAEITVYNGTAEPHPFLWWANMAVEVNDDYKIVFPPDVEYVNDHDRRTVLEWPVARGVYRTARPYDYGGGTDVHTFSAIKVPTSVMVSRWQSEADFLSGYDPRAGAGVVTVADHNISPGKKLWTWGDSPFGNKWCANLTDDGSRYVELMTGCYTDNQPDFTYIEPYETKTFVQYWYPIRDIGEVKSATPECAAALEPRGGGVFAGIYCVRPATLAIALSRGGEAVYSAEARVSPDKPFTHVVETGVPLQELTLTVREGGKTLLEYRSPVRGHKRPIEPRLPALPPKEIPTTEELWLNGAHLMQYKHFTYRPEDYFAEALARDGGDIRSNQSMGDIMLARGKYEEAEKHYTAAIERLTLRNPNPSDTEAYYKRALCALETGETDRAYADAYAAVWNYRMCAAGYYLLAKIASKRGERAEALRFLDLSLKTNADNLWALYIRDLLAGDRNADENIRRRDPLFLPDGSERRGVAFAQELLSFGLAEQAEQVLQRAQDGAIKFYLLAEIYRGKGEDEQARAYVKRADGCPYACEFPSGRAILPVLRAAATPRAYYYLGCALYALERYDEACAAWEQTVRAEPFAPAYRNLALGYYDHLSQPQRARECLETARRLAPESGRIFYELTQLYRALNLPRAERLALYETAPERVAERDDCTLDYSVLLAQEGEYDKALGLLLAHRFHTYEGGEGHLTQHHAWLHFLMGEALEKEGKYEKAQLLYESGLVFPDHYGEEKTYFVNDAPLYLGIARCRAALGDGEGERSALRLAVGTKGAPSVQSYYQCAAYRMAGDEKQADSLSREMIRLGKERLASAGVTDYYGVGAPSYPPFGYDVARANTLSGSVLLAFGLLAAREREKAEEQYRRAAAIDGAAFFVWLLGKELNH